MLIDTVRMLPLLVVMMPVGSAAFPAQMTTSSTHQDGLLLSRPAGLDIVDRPVSGALLELQRTSGTPIAFSPTLLPPGHRVSCACSDTTVAGALDRILAGLDFEYLELAGQIVIQRTRGPGRPAARAVPIPGDVDSGATVQTPALIVSPRERTVDEERGFFARLFGIVRERGSITGRVIAKETGRPLAGAQVYVVGLNIGRVTDDDGRFVIRRVPAGTHVIAAQFFGYVEQRQSEVAVPVDGLAALDFELEPTVFPLQELVVTGVSDPTAGVKLPFTVARVNSDQLRVPTTNSALASVQGKVAGLNIQRPSGRPGSGVNIMLRSPASFERSNSPLIVVDGIILSRSFSNTTSDIEALDIESVEVIKGAAAATLYGSRAADGVISFKTRRGSDLPRGRTRITAHLEIGQDFLSGGLPLTEAHHYSMNEAGTALVNAAGRDTTWAGRTPTPLRIADLPYPGRTFDNINQLYRPGRYLQNAVTLAHNSENTTFMLSGTRLDQTGTLANTEGYERTQGRISIDHRVGDNLSISLSGLHSRTFEDLESGDPFEDILTYPVYVDLSRRGPDGRFMQQPDPTVELENPLWRQSTRENHEWRARTLASVNAQWYPLSWISLDGQFSYDRSDVKEQIFVPKGVPTSVTDEVPAAGRLFLANRETNTYNASLAVALLRRFGDVNARLTTRALLERESSERFSSDGRDFLVEGVRDLDAAGTVFDVESQTLDIRANGFLFDLGLDYKDRYIASFLVRRDGSSLFGPEERWKTYKRAAAAWRISEESWFKVPFITELKIKYAMGEAGGRPNFADQFELWSISRTFGLTRGTAGNTQLKPQFTREQEFGVDIIALDRVSLEVVHARQTSRDQIIALPVTAVTGFNSVLGNGGEIQGQSYEVTLNVNPVRRPNLSWSFGFVADYTTNELTRWDRACFFGSNAGRTHEFTCAGQRAGDFWTQTHMRNPDQLPSWLAGRASEFQVNDDGYLVWVGEGNSWRDGIAKGLWGTSFAAHGTTYYWGEPIIRVDENGVPVRENTGTSLADLNFGFNTSFRYGGLSVYALFRGQLGGNVYNRSRQWLYNQLRHGDVDQSRKPDERKKTVDYYQRALYNGDNWTDAFLEDATHVKLGELAVRYRFTRSQLATVFGSAAPEDLSIGANARNLFTLSGYRGFDPERGSTLSRVDTVTYPHVRNFTLTVDITF